MSEVETKLNFKYSPVYKQWTRGQEVVSLIKHDDYAYSAVIYAGEDKYTHYFFFFIGTSWQISADVSEGSAESVFKSIAKRAEA